MPLSYRVELQRSKLGTIGEGHWALVAVLVPSPNTTPAIPGVITYEDYGVVRDSSYYYRVRWTVSDTDLGPETIGFGPWSRPVMVTIRNNRIITIVGGEIYSQLTLGYEEYEMSGIITPSGAQSRLGFGLQTDYNTAVQATALAEYRSGGGNANRMIAYSSALRDTPSARIKGQVTDFEANGSVVIELTPEGTLPLLLTALFGPPTTTSYYADVTGAPTVWSAATTYAAAAKVKRGSYYYTSVGSGNLANKPECDAAGTFWTPVPDLTSGITANFRSYRHVWKHKWLTQYVSMHQLKGNTVESFVRGLVHSFKVGVSRSQREIITGTFDVQFANQFLPSLWDDVDGGAGYDTLPPFTAAQGKVLVNGVVGANFREFNADVTRKIGGKNVLNGKLGPAGFTNSGSESSGSLTAFFDDETHLQRFMGYSSAYTKPVGFNGELVYADVQCVLAYNTPGSGGSLLEYDSKLVSRFPRCLYGSVSQPVSGKEEIMQSIALEPCLDGTEDTDVVFEVWNRQSNTSIITVGTTLAVPCSAVE